jgi:anti-sigma-K factor RskA
MTHDDLRESLAAWAIGALREQERQEVDAHLAVCAACRDESAGFTAIPLALAATGPLETPGAAVRARILSHATVRPVDVTPVRLPQGTQPAVVRSSPWPWLATAASLILATYLGLDGMRLRNQLETLTRELRDARAAAAATETRLAALQQAADRSQSAFAVLVAPDVARIDLAGQPGNAAGASGRAFWSRTRGMVFSATALPAPPPGHTYQVWVVTSAPAPVSAGLIDPDQDGRVNAVFATPADIPQPIAVTVTLEPAGGVPAPTGPKVLVGTV